MPHSILITGGAGYLGSVLCQKLLAHGHRVHVLDNLLFGQHSLFHLCHERNFSFTFGDCRNEATVAPLVSQSDIIIPLAALVGAPLCDRDPLGARSINLEAVQLINRLRSPNQLVIYPNTNSGYGISSGEAFCTEESPLAPISLYGRTKCQAELELLDSPNAITFRLATVFGMSPRMRIDLLVNHFVYAAVTDGYLVLFEKDFKRNFVHVRDVADCFVFAIDHAERMIGRAFNVGLDEANLSKEQLAETIKRHVPSFYIHYAPIGVDPDKRNYIVSSERLKQVGFTARRSLDEGIEELIKGYRMLGRGPLKNV